MKSKLFFASFQYNFHPLHLIWISLLEKKNIAEANDCYRHFISKYSLFRLWQPFLCNFVDVWEKRLYLLRSTAL